MRLYALLLIFSLSLDLNAQVDLSELKSQLNFYGDVMVSALDSENRSFAADKFYIGFLSYMDSVNVYDSDMSDFRTLSVLPTEDDKFKLISWQIEKDSYDYNYKGFVVYPDGTYVELNDSRDIDNSIQYVSLSTDEWYGALYYNIKKVDDNNYLVFGYNGFGQYDHCKIADVIELSDDGISLGAELFEDKADLGTYMKRIMVKYSSDASVNLNYNPGLKMIVMDHLLPRMGKQQGQGPTMFPDGSYEGFEMIDGKWKYIEKLYNHSYGENNAPRPKPVLGKKKDLFGN